MHRDRVVHGLAAIAVVVVGLLALTLPTALDEFDAWGFRISCGSGLEADYGQAEIASQVEQSSDYVAECESAIWWRRSWAGALVLLGVGLTLVLALRWQREVPSGSRTG